ncbi:ankyrin repeat-containing domain protein, partial [Schizophyllum commune]
LHKAAWRGHICTVSLVFARGANVTVLDNAHLTPSHKCEGCIDIVNFLVDCGAALEARGTNGRTPLYLAVSCGHENAVELLLDLGSDPRTSADDGTTLLDV